MTHSQLYDIPHRNYTTAQFFFQKMISVFLLLVLLCVGAHTAPTRELGEVDPPVDDDPTLEELSQILEEGLLNNTQNLETIRAAFEVEPGAVKICVLLTYYIFPTDQEDCVNETTSYNCTNGCTTTFIWTNFDATSLSGKFLFAYASENLKVFGFEWAGACDVSVTNNLNLTIPSLLCTPDDTLIKMLSNLTQKVSMCVWIYIIYSLLLISLPLYIYRCLTMLTHQTMMISHMLIKNLTI